MVLTFYNIIIKMDKGLWGYIKYKINGFTGITPKMTVYNDKVVYVFDPYELSIMDDGQYYVFYLYNDETERIHEWEIDKLQSRDDLYDDVDAFFDALYPVR